MISLALQALLVILLLLTIAWCVLVHSRLRRLHADRGELECFIADLVEATARAEATVQQMREAGRAIENAAVEREGQVRQQAEGLARLIESASRVARQLDKAIEPGSSRLDQRPTELSHSAATSADLSAGEYAGVRQQVPAVDERAACRVSPDQDRSTKLAAPGTQRRAQSGKNELGSLVRKGRAKRPLHDLDAFADEDSGATASMRRAGQLDGLLNRELREALQSLR